MDKDALYAAAMAGDADAIVKLEMEADKLTDIYGVTHCTILHVESWQGNTDRVTFILRKFANKNLLVRLDIGKQTALNYAAYYGHPEVVEVLIDAARQTFEDNDDPVFSSFQAFLRHPMRDLDTALSHSVVQGYLPIVKMLVDADPTDRHIQNNRGKTPIYIAVEKGFTDIVKLLCTTCKAPSLDGPGGTTALHAAILNIHYNAKEEDRDVIRMIIDAAKRWSNSEDAPHESLGAFFQRTDAYGRTVLELAMERNYLDMVEMILLEDPAYNCGRGNNKNGLMRLIYKAIDMGYGEDIVKLLSETYEAGIITSHKGVVDLILAIKRRDKASVLGILQDNKHLVSFVDDEGWTPLHYATYHEFDLILDAITDAQKDVGYKFVYGDNLPTPFHVGVEFGYTSTVIRLMEIWPTWSSAYTNLNKNCQNVLHLAAAQNKKEMIQGILKYCPESYKDKILNQQDANGDTPLHLLISNGCFIPEIIKQKGLDTTIKNKEKWTPLDMFYCEDKIIADQALIKMALEDVQTNQKADILESLVLPSKRKAKDLELNKYVKLMMAEEHARMKQDLETYKRTHTVAHWFRDAIAGDASARAALEMEADLLNEEGETILHVESKRGDTERVRYIVREFANKNLLVKVDRLKQTALHLAAHHGHTQVVEVLIDAARRNLLFSSAKDDPVDSFHAFLRQATNQKRNTALHVAVNKGNMAIVKLLVEADPGNKHIPNHERKTPIYIAAENGSIDIIKVICTTCTTLCLDGPGGSTTALHAAILKIHQVKEEDRNVIRMMIDAAKRWSSAEDTPNVSFEALFNRTDISGRTVLELAVDRNYADIVELILLENPAYQHGRGSKNGLMRLIYKAIDKEYTDIVKLLSETYEAGITTGHKGVVALILAINRRDEESVIRLLGEAKHLVTFADDEGWTPLHYAAYHEFVSILDIIIEALKDVKYPFVYGDMVSTPFHVAAECKYTSTVIQLMQAWPASSSAYTAINKNGQNILHMAAVNNKKEMILGILKYCPENYKDKILEQQDANGDTPLHLLVSNGCFIPELIKHKGLDTMAKNKKKWTPRDMLYFQEEIIADQVQIKIALDDVQTNRSWKFWHKNVEKKTDILKSIVLPSKRETKDVIFNKYTKLLMDEKSLRMKKDLERYKKRTNTQIIVTALITTITFTVGFTMPGGLHQSGEVEEGLVVLSRKRAFNAFMVSDALALVLSTSSLFFYFLESINEDPHQVSKLNAASTVLNIVSVMAMMLTFIAGTYVVLSHSPALAITVCIISSLFFLLITIILIKIVYDRVLVKKNKD